MCRSGRSCGSSSRAPAGTSNHGVSGSGFGTGDPQRPQKYVRYPGATSRTGASYARINSRPEVRRKSSRRTPTAALNAEPPAFRHLVQWHSSNGPTARVISNFTPPQRQLPWIITGSPVGSGKLEGAPSNGELERPHRSASPWRRGRTLSQRPRRQTRSASRPPPTIVRSRPNEDDAHSYAQRTRQR